MKYKMALYRCTRPNCPGHDSFSAICPPPPVHEYALLHSFIQLLETQPMEKPIDGRFADSVPSSNQKDYINFWRED
jgi:hypothetical protein